MVKKKKLLTIKQELENIIIENAKDKKVVDVVMDNRKAISTIAAILLAIDKNEHINRTEAEVLLEEALKKK